MPSHASSHPWATRLFNGAGVYGLVVLLPMYGMEGRIGQDMPPAITHPEFFYGFLGVAVAWQILFLILARDPVRYRLMMLPALVEKWSYALACLTLFLQGRLAGAGMVFGAIDGVLGALFLAAFLATRPAPSA